MERPALSRLATIAPVALAVPVALAALVACAGASAPVAPLLDEAQQAELKSAEALYRRGDAGFGEVRDRLARDPATAFWLTRLFVWDLVRAVDALAGDDDQFLRAAIGVRDPRVSAAVEQLRAIAPAAVPAITADLLRSPFSDRRRLAVDVLGAMGPGVLPGLMPVLEDGDWRVRQAVVRTAMQIEGEGDGARALLERAAADPHFAVRATAFEGLAASGEAAAPRLREALSRDPDQFVRRTVATALGEFRDLATAAVLVEFYAAALAAGDRDGVRAADDSLRRLAGRDRGGDLSFWRAWLASRAPAEG